MPKTKCSKIYLNSATALWSQFYKEHALAYLQPQL